MSHALRYGSEALAERYSRFRPTYPESVRSNVIDYMARRFGKGDAKKRQWRALDVGCGSGQSTAMFARADEISKVYGLDASTEQIKRASARFASSSLTSKLEFVESRAEATPFPASSMDLITCGASLHWLDLEEFFAEVDRLLVPGGCLAAFSYDVDVVNNPSVNEVLHTLLYVNLRDYATEPILRHLPSSYETIAFPYGTPERISFTVDCNFTVDDCVGFVSSLAAYKFFTDEHPSNRLLEEVRRDLQMAYNNEPGPLPLSLRAFLVLTSKPSS